LVVDDWLTLNLEYTPMGITPEAGIQVDPSGGSAHGPAGEHERIECFHRLALAVGE